MKNVALNRLQKEHFFTSLQLQAKQEGSVVLFDLRWEHMHWVTQIFSCSVHVLK